MNCEKIRDLIPELGAKGLSPEEEKQVMVHLETCPGCKKEMEKQKILIAGMKTFFTKLDVGKKSIVVPFPAELPSSFPNPLFIWGTVLTFALIVGFIFLFPLSREKTPLPGKDPLPAGFGTNVELMSVLRNGTLLDQEKKGTWQKGASLRENLAYSAVEESGIEHLKRILFTVSQGTRFNLTPNGIDLGPGGSRFDVRPGSGSVKIRTPSAVLGVLGTKFDVLSGPEMTLVHLIRGRLRVEGKHGVAVMGPQEMLMVPAASSPRSIQVPEGLWEFFVAHHSNWEKAAQGRFLPKGRPPLPQGTPAPRPLPPVASKTETIGASTTFTAVVVSSESVPATPSGILESASTTTDVNNPDEAMGGGE